MERMEGVDAGYLYMETPAMHMHTLKIALVHENLVRPVEAESFEGRVVLRGRTVSALEALAPQEPAECLRLGLARDDGDPDPLVHYLRPFPTTRLTLARFASLLPGLGLCLVDDRPGREVDTCSVYEPSGSVSSGCPSGPFMEITKSGPTDA